MRPRLYLSGPITKGSRTENFSVACNTHTALLGKGFAVMNPMLSMMHPDAWTIPHATWLESDLPWVAVSDVVFRLPGESAGADEECQFAETKGIPVFTRWHELMAWLQTWQAAQPRSVANGT